MVVTCSRALRRLRDRPADEMNGEFFGPARLGVNTRWRERPSPSAAIGRYSGAKVLVPVQPPLGEGGLARLDAKIGLMNGTLARRSAPSRYYGDDRPSLPEAASPTQRSRPDGFATGGEADPR